MFLSSACLSKSVSLSLAYFLFHTHTHKHTHTHTYTHLHTHTQSLCLSRPFSFILRTHRKQTAWKRLRNVIDCLFLASANEGEWRAQIVPWECTVRPKGELCVAWLSSIRYTYMYGLSSALKASFCSNWRVRTHTPLDRHSNMQGRPVGLRIKHDV